MDNANIQLFQVFKGYSVGKWATSLQTDSSFIEIVEDKESVFQSNYSTEWDRCDVSNAIVVQFFIAKLGSYSNP